MTQQEHEIPGSFVLQILSTGLLPADAHTRIHDVLRQVGLTLDGLAKADTRIPIRWLEHFLSSNEGQSPNLTAMMLGEQVLLTSHGRLSLLLMTSATIREAMKVTPFLPLLTTAASLHFTESARAGRLYICPHTGAPIDDLIVFYVGAAARQLLTLLTGRESEAVVQVSAPMPAEFENHPGFNPSQWQFNAPTNCVIVSKECLDRLIVFADPVTFERTLRSCESALENLQQQASLVQRVRKLLHDCSRYPEQEEVARTLNMSCSTLKRRLAEESSTFNDLLRESKCQRAIRLLTGTDLSCQEIADQLGFSSQTNFTHAFKKWTGVSPVGFRKKA